MTDTAKSYNPLALDQPAGSTTVEPMRILAYGKSQTRKTWWSGTAAATHRVWVLDGENNTGILRMLPDDWRTRVNRIPLASKPDHPAFAMFVTMMFKTKAFLWSLTESRIMEPRFINDTHDEHWFLDVDINRLTTDDVLVMDSWTKYVSDIGLAYAHENGVDLYAGERGKKTTSGKNDGIDYFRHMDIALDAALQGLQSMPCHVILTGHQQEYESERRTALGVKKVTKIQVISGSGKHSAKVPAYLSDTLYFDANDDGKSSTINTASEALRDGGGTNIAPAQHQFPGWDWSTMYAETNKPLPVIKPYTTERPSPFRALTGKEIRDLMAAAQATRQTQTPSTVGKGTNTGIITQRK